MNKKVSLVKKGFSLIEWIISLSILVLLISYALQFFVVSASRLYSGCQNGVVCSELCSAFDTVVRYIYSAPCDSKKWKGLQKGKQVWHDANKKRDVGCLFENGNLFLVVGTYIKGTWKKRRKNLLVRNIKRFELIPHIKKKIVRSVTCIIEGECNGRIYTFKRTTNLRNRCMCG